MRDYRGLIAKEGLKIKGNDDGFINEWLGRLDSNQGMPVPKTGALPLGYAPTNRIKEIDCAGL